MCKLTPELAGYMQAELEEFTGNNQIMTSSSFCACSSNLRFPGFKVKATRRGAEIRLEYSNICLYRSSMKLVQFWPVDGFLLRHRKQAEWECYNNANNQEKADVSF